MPASRTACAVVIALVITAGCTQPPAPEQARPAPPVPATPTPAPTQPPTPTAARTWDFEQDVAGWAPWGTTDQDAAARSRVVGRSGTGPHQGSGCLQVSDDLAGANLYATTNPAIPARPGQAWQLSLWIRCATADQPRPEVAVAAESEDPAKPWLGWIAHVTVATSAEWRLVQLAVPAAPAGTTRLRVAVRPVALPDPTLTATVFVDDVRLVPESLQHLDLAPAFNRGLRDEVAGDGLGGWTDQGDNDLRGQPAGPLSVGGLTFTIADPARAAIALSTARAGFVPAATLPIGRTCDRLHLLHTAAWAGGGATVGTLTWRYGDGGTAQTPVVAGDTVGDWWNGHAARAASAALRGVDPKQPVVYLFATAFANPHPDRGLAAVELAAAPGLPIWLVLGAATSTGTDPQVGGAIAERDRSTWPVFRPAPSLPEKPLVDLSNLLDAPAGKHGFVHREGGRLLFADGSRARFWGTNIHSCMGIFPSHEQAERLAATLARYGLNLVRLHLPDSGLVDLTRADRQGMVEEARLERFDYLVKCLRDRGIYILVDAVSGMSGRKLGAADGLEGGYSAHRPGAYYVPRLRQLAEDWSRLLLTRRNLHTGRALVDEPAVAMVLIQNEQSMFYDPHAEKTPIPATYRRILEEGFAAWLRSRYTDRAGLAAAWGGELRAEDDPAGAIALAPFGDIGRGSLGAGAGHAGPGGPLRSRDTAAYMLEVQTAYDRSFTAHLRALGVKVPVIGTNLLFSPAELAAQQVNDLSCHNNYYEHIREMPDGGIQFANRPQPLLDLMAGDRDLETGVAAAQLAGLAHSSTETATMFPQEWRSAYGLSIAATSAHQDWDAVMHYSYMGGWGYTCDTMEAAAGVLQSTVVFNDPAIVGLFPAASLMYLRGDVAPGSSHVQVVYTEAERTAARSLTGEGCFPYGYLAHVSRVDAAFGSPVGDPAAVVGAVPAGGRGVSWPASDPRGAAKDLDRRLKEWGVIPKNRGWQGQSLVSDTGEIVRDWGHGVITVDTARSQGVSGFLGGAPQRLRDVEIGLPGGGFATVVVSSLDGQPIASSRRLLLTTVGRAENDDLRLAYGEIATAPDGTRYGERLTVTRAKKPGAIRLEPVYARIVLGGRSATVTPLAADLQAAGPARPAQASGDGRLVVTTGDPATAWQVIDIER